ncbi:MAG: hypothetical protein K2P17_00530 [Helicobacteraceae bacterium]|nr:hypothetical protein [Helicobacteraceae bacterium]
MINKILNIAKLSQITQNSNIKTFNTTLPILLQVLEKTRMGYMLKLGNSTIEARSPANLQIGAKYWAIVKDSSVGEIIIQNLIKQPKIFDYVKSTSLSFEMNEFQTMIKEKKFSQNFYDKLIDSTINAENKEDFLFLSNALLAYEKKITNLVIKDRNKRILLQIKNKKRDKIDFSAIFGNLGVIAGSIYESNILILKVQYQNVKNLLEKSKDRLEGFSEIKILLDENTSILFDMLETQIIEA